MYEHTRTHIHIHAYSTNTHVHTKHETTKLGVNALNLIMGNFVLFMQDGKLSGFQEATDAL